MSHVKDSQQDIKTYIGENYHSFFNENDRIRRWNFSGLAFGMFWLTYRKRYLIVSVFILIDISVSVLFRNHLFYWLIFAVLMHLYIGKSGTLLYIAGTKKHIKKIKLENPQLSEKELDRLLIKKGGTSWRLILPLLIYFVLVHTYIFIDDLKMLLAL